MLSFFFIQPILAQASGNSDLANQPVFFCAAGDGPQPTAWDLADAAPDASAHYQPGAGERWLSALADLALIIPDTQTLAPPSWAAQTFHRPAWAR